MSLITDAFGTNAVSAAAVRVLPSEDFAAEVGPELGGQIDEAIIGDIDGEVAEDSSTGATWGWVVKIRKARAHGAAEDVIEIKSVGAVVFANDHRAADRVSKSVEQGTGGAFAVIVGIFVEHGSNNEISGEVLGGNVSVGGSKALRERIAIGAVLGVGPGNLGEDGVESPSPGGQWPGGFMEEVVPAFARRIDCLRLWGWR